MQKKWQDEDGGYDFLYHAILHSTAAAIYHWLTQDGDQKKNSKHGFSDMYMYCHFLQINCHCNGIITGGFIILIWISAN